MSAGIERVSRAANRPPRRAATQFVHRLGRIGPAALSSAVIGLHAVCLAVPEQPLGVRQEIRRFRVSTPVSVVSPCVVTPLGEPVLVLPVPTPVSRRAVQQRDLAVSALGCFRGSRGRSCGRRLDQFATSVGCAAVSARNGPERVLRPLRWNSLLTQNGAAGRRSCESVAPITAAFPQIGGRRRRWSATCALCQWRVSCGHGAVSPIHALTCLVSVAEPTADERWPTWQDSLSFRRKRSRGVFHAWTGRRNFPGRGSRGCPVAVCGDARLRNSGHFSQTTPAPSPSRALGTIHLGNPLPPPLLPCTQRSPAA